MLRNKKKNKVSDQYYDDVLITNISPNSQVAEAYRTLRTNIGFAAAQGNCRSILMTSCSPQDGKSTSIANIAVSFALAGNKTVLFDCDLRKPVLHHIFGIPNHQGLTNCLLEKITIEEVGHREVIENLLVVTSGPIPPNPSELLGNVYTKAFFKAVLDEYDYVFIDAPPVLAVADTSLLASQADGVILMITATSTKTKLAKATIEQLERANANILGVILNKVTSENKFYHEPYIDEAESVFGNLK